MSDPVRIMKEGEICCVLLCRPDAYNAFNLDLTRSFAESLVALAADERVRGIVILGEGKAFSAGGDLRYALASPQNPPAVFHQLAGLFHQAVLEIRRMPKPVIAAVNGAAAGGGFSLALACDFRVMSESATLKQAYTSSGLCLDGGGTFTLPRLVGLARALEIVAFDQPISAAQALSWGLATRVVQDGKAVEEAMNMARELAGRSMHSFGWAKRLLTDSFNTGFESILERERRGLEVCADHADGREGLRAFAEKRKPRFPPG